MEKLHLVIQKKQRRLEIYDGARLIKTYRIALGFAPIGDKRVEGDGRTPEGKFYVFTKNVASKYHRSLGLSYPNVEAAQRGLRDKIISRDEHDAIIEAVKNQRMPPQKTALGGEIYIHGGGAQLDWTGGCAALEDADVSEIYEMIAVGAKVEIKS